MASRWYREEQTRVYFAFAPADLVVVTSMVDDLKQLRPGITIDYAPTSEPFAVERSDYIRASLALRIRRAAALICLFRSDVLRDDWVLWSLEVAHRLGIPLVGTPLGGTTAPAALDLLSSAGVDIVPCEARALSAQLGESLARPRVTTPVDETLAQPLSFMAHRMR